MELVVLVNEQNQELGRVDKATVHSHATPLHRGFSLFLFNSKNELLLTQRALSKKTFPGVWTNTVCGHPAPNETPEKAAVRRLKDEMGVEVKQVKLVSPYRYRFADKNGIFENEICPVLIAYADVEPIPNQDEIDSWKWVSWKDFLSDIKADPDKYSPWCREEALLMDEYLKSA